MNAPVRHGEVEPVAELFAEHGDFVFRTLQYLGVSAGVLDDALQDVFITAHRKWDAFEGRSTARTWLYGIARRVAFRYRRKDQNRQRRFVLTERPVEGVDAPFEQAHARRSVQALLEGLDEAKRAAFVLVEVEGFTAPEAAELLEIPLGTVYSRVRAAWARLRQSAQDDLALAAMRPELPRSRRETLQRALVAACIPAATTAKVASVGILGGAAWVWGLGVAAVVGATVVIGLREPDPEPAAVLDDGYAEPVTPAKVDAPSQPRETAHAAASVPPPELVQQVPANVPATATAKAPPREPVTAPPSPATPRTEAPTSAPVPESTLVDELRLLRAAKEHARDGEPEAAQKVLEEHARRFPNGQLQDERKEVQRSLAGEVTASQQP